MGDLLALGAEHAGRYDIVCCHGGAMYLPSLDKTIAAPCGACPSDGLVSVLTRNRAGIAMRTGMTGDWASAVQEHCQEGVVCRLHQVIFDWLDTIFATPSRPKS
jgi:hypothetical protein